ncbi:MAG: hypothetical protein WBW85_13200, partial [Terriglobales bacterium]
ASSLALVAQERQRYTLCSVTGSRRCRFMVRGPDRDYHMHVPVPQVHRFAGQRFNLLFTT